MEGKGSVSNFKIALVYLCWWMVWMVDQTYLLLSLGWSWETSVLDTLVTQLTLAMGGYALNTTLRYYRPDLKNALSIIIWSLVIAGMLLAIQHWTLVWLSQSVEYTLFLSQAKLTRFMFDWLMMSFISLMSWLWFFMREQQENEKRKQDAEQLARHAELTTLRQQLQPHFLFNSLNSISALAVSKPEEARKMVQQLSDFLRGTLKKDDKQLVTLEEELSHLQLYLDIEKVRFGYRLETEIINDDVSVKMKLPSLLLQPVVENAIKFGLYDTTGATRITIEAKAENNTLVLQVKNPFDSITSSSRQGTGFGLSSIQRRLYLLYSRNDLLLTEQHENEFTTTIKIPQTI